MGSTDKNVALVFGASGISGWAVTNNLLSYPTPTTFSRVIGLSNRPIEREASLFPDDEPRLEFYSGINLRADLPTVKEQLQTTVPNLQDVTHVYYLAYSNATAYSLDVMDVRDINVAMTGNAVRAVDEICASLKFFVLQTGTNNYGVAVFDHKDHIEINPPLKESQPRIPPPYGDEIFYYGQVDLVREVQAGKSWKWCEVRPDCINGFTPNSSSMTWLEPMALYLALWRYVYGSGAEVKHIGTLANYMFTYTESSQDIIARSEIYLSVVKPDEAHGEAFNIADYSTPISSAVRWPLMAGYFGLKGTGPDETIFPAEQWWKEHQDDYKRMCEEYGLRSREISPETWVFLTAWSVLLDRNRSLSLDKIRAIGFTEGLPPGGGSDIALDHLVAVKRIPPGERGRRRRSDTD